MPGAGKMRERVTFQQRGLDANGDRLGDWEAGFDAAADMTWLRGTEAVMQARLQGRQPVVITVYEEDRTRAVTNAWRAVDARDTTRVFDIKSVAPARRRGFLDILAELEPITAAEAEDE